VLTTFLCPEDLARVFLKFGARRNCTDYVKVVQITISCKDGKEHSGIPT